MHSGQVRTNRERTEGGRGKLFAVLSYIRTFVLIFSFDFQIGSNYHPSSFDPHGYAPNEHHESLLRAQNQHFAEKQKKAREQSKKVAEDKATKEMARKKEEERKRKRSSRWGGANGPGGGKEIASAVAAAAAAAALVAKDLKGDTPAPKKART